MRTDDQSKYASNLFILDAAQGVILYSFGENSLRYAKSSQLKDKTEIAVTRHGKLAFLDTTGKLHLCGQYAAGGVESLDDCQQLSSTNDRIIQISTSSSGESVLATTGRVSFRFGVTGVLQRLSLPESVQNIVAIAGGENDVFLAFNGGQTLGRFSNDGETLAIRDELRINLAGIPSLPPDSIDFDATSVVQSDTSFFVHVFPHGHTVQLDPALETIDWWSTYSLPYPGRPFHGAHRLRATAGGINELQYVDRRSLTVFTDYDLGNEGRYHYRLPDEVSSLLDRVLERHAELGTFPVDYDFLRDPAIQAELEAMRLEVENDD